MRLIDFLVFHWILYEQQIDFEWMLIKFHMIGKLSSCINEYLLIGVFDVCKKASENTLKI